jgi:23S rRNA (uracil1939-C5)-methyltransferase
MRKMQASTPRHDHKQEAEGSASSAFLKKNEEYSALVTDQNHLGHGVCRIGNTVVFVPHAVAGEQVKLRIIKVAKNYAVARLLEVETQSENRITPSCESAKRCGGCVFPNITYEAECDWKRAYVKVSLQKAGLPDIEVAPLLTTRKTQGYRNKVQYPVGEDFVIGYYANHSHEIIPCRHCELQSRAFDDILDALTDWGKHYHIPNVRHIYLRHAVMTDQICVCLVSQKPTLPHEAELIEALTKFERVKSIYLNVNPDDTNVILGKKSRLLWGAEQIEDILCGLRFSLSPHSFYQVNHDAAELLYQRVFALADVRAGDKVADLYCGAGTIGLCLISRHPDAHLVGVEIVPQAIENARANAEKNGIQNAQFYCGDALHPAIEGADIIIVDPPRKGCSPALIARICEIAPRQVVYVSCNPDTFARDLKLFRLGGYQIGQVTPVDLFARTGHVESVVSLQKIN